MVRAVCQVAPEENQIQKIDDWTREHQFAAADCVALSRIVPLAIRCRDEHQMQGRFRSETAGGKLIGEPCEKVLY